MFRQKRILNTKYNQSLDKVLKFTDISLEIGIRSEVICSYSFV